MRHSGIIFLDGTEVIIQIYAMEDLSNITLLHCEIRDLATFKSSTSIKSSDVIEVIAEASFTGYAKSVDDWKIYARNVPESIIRDISQATGMPVETLLLSREQTLLCLGLIMDDYSPATLASLKEK